MNDYLVDTSIWIDYFRGKSKAIKDRIHKLLGENRIFYNGIIFSELLIGTNSKRESIFIEENFSGLHYLTMDIPFFLSSGRVGNQLKTKGFTLPLSDIYIATHAKINNLIIFTRDNHFASIGQSIGCQFEVITY